MVLVSIHIPNILKFKLNLSFKLVSFFFGNILYETTGSLVGLKENGKEGAYSPALNQKTDTCP